MVTKTRKLSFEVTCCRKFGFANVAVIFESRNIYLCIHFDFPVHLSILVHLFYYLQCFDAVGWAAGRASGL